SGASSTKPFLSIVNSGINAIFFKKAARRVPYASGLSGVIFYLDNHQENDEIAIKDVCFR
ncbi:MAG TPA: hypothetical protein VKO67_11805, partial [Smithellaceae bacterium]|nr:hypothetical protein [Smithellaceae bacterium]